jgi:V8-like Glu-specific endopeptidase
MPWNENLTNLNHVLAGLYPIMSDSYRIVEDAGLPRTQIPFRARAIDNWYEILSEADKRGKLENLIKVVRKEYPENPFLEKAEEGGLWSTRGPIVDKDLTWNTQQPAENLERIMGRQSTLLPIGFLEIGLQRARSVARVVLENGSLGSGFIMPNNLFVTNNHVLQSRDDAENAIIQFNYQKTTQGLDLAPIDFHLAPGDIFITSPEDDWTVVSIRGNANAGWGAIDIAAVDVKATDRVNIIQHPGGGHKQIALYHNIVAYVDDRRIQYLTDTMPGSSGSPVFDSQWKVVGLHHSGGWIQEPGSKQQVFRNEGINVNCIVNGLRQAGLT